MERFVRRFLRASLVWLALGITFGLCMAIHPQWIIYRPAHVHMNLVGFVTMMIFGVAYHVIPRFSGHPLRSNRLPLYHWWVSNLGLVGMVTGFVLQPHARALGAVALVSGGILETLGAYLFVYNIWRTLSGSVPVAAPVPRRPLPVNP